MSRMRNSSMFYLLCLVVVLSVSCGKENLGTNSGEDFEEIFLQHDGRNQSSPTLSADRWEAAVRFPAATTLDVKGGELVEIHYYVRSLPETCQLKVYGAATASQPGALLYSADVLPETTAPRWNMHELTIPVEITGRDLWLSVAFSHSRSLPTIGCDPGFAKAGGDWLFKAGDGQWLTLRARSSNSIDVNWNIRGLVRISKTSGTSPLD